VNQGESSDLVEHLRRVGFTQYEARVYISLARTGPLNGNEISLASQVPSSKIYETLRKLVAKGAVATFARDDGTKYVALPPSQVIERYRENMNSVLDHLEVELGQLGAFEVEEQVLSMRGELSVISRVREVIESAHRTLYLSLWAQELPTLRKALLEAYGRGVRMHVMLYGEADLPVEYVYRHVHADIVSARIGGRMVVAIADDAEVAVARFAPAGQIYGISTQNQALVLLAHEYLGHDIMLECAKERMAREEWDAWWRSREDLREVILNPPLPQRTDRKDQLLDDGDFETVEGAL